MAIEINKNPFYPGPVEIARINLGLRVEGCYPIQPIIGLPREELERIASIAWSRDGITREEIRGLGMCIRENG